VVVLRSFASSKAIRKHCLQGKGTNLDAIVVDDPILCPYNQRILAIMLGRYCSVAFGQNLEILAILDQFHDGLHFNSPQAHLHRARS